MSEEDSAFFNSMVDGLRRHGWSKQDAEDYAIEKLNDKWFPRWKEQHHNDDAE